MRILNLTDIIVSPSRIRREFPAQAMEELIQSILSKGLLHPPVVEKNNHLLAGERRYRALTEIARRGLDHQCNGKTLLPGLIVITDISELSPMARLEAELEENIIRLDLSWQEKAQATDALHKLRELQKQAATPTGIGAELQTPRDTAAEIKGKALEEVTRDDARDVSADLTVAAWLAVGEDDEVSKAPTRKEALKIIERKLEDSYRAELGKRFIASKREGQHTLKQLDMTQALPLIPQGIFDCIVTDPPWGVGADQWENGNAIRAHTYLDDMHLAEKIYTCLAYEGYRITKTRAHIYVLCSFGNFSKWAPIFRAAGWDVWPRPLIWYKGSNSGIAPRAEHGPRLTYECILYALKGDKRVLFSAPDLIVTPGTGPDQRAAEKPASLYYELLRRSVVPGDEILDPCCGAGPIFPAANALQVTATGYDSATDAIGIASQRLHEKYEAPQQLPPTRLRTAKV